MTLVEHGFERLTGQGQVVPNEARPSKSGRLYGNTDITDSGGHLSPHMLAQSFMPVAGKGGEDLAGPYEVIEGWPATINDGWRMAGPSGAVVFLTRPRRGDLALRPGPRSADAARLGPQRLPDGGFAHADLRPSGEEAGVFRRHVRPRREAGRLVDPQRSPVSARSTESSPTRATPTVTCGSPTVSGSAFSSSPATESW